MIKHGPVAILLVTVDNRAYVETCLRSILANTRGVAYHIYLINNGIHGSCAWARNAKLTVLERGENTSWVGGLAQGALHSEAPYLLFLNDDVVIPPSDPLWLYKLVARMDDPTVGAVGPGSNLVSGWQSILMTDAPVVYTARFLISFCCLVRRAALESAGGLDVSMTNADDIDYSIRLRQAGYTLLGDRNVYVHHHGFVTGNRLHGDRWRSGGYNSREWAARNLNMLIARHGEEAIREVYQGGQPAPYLGITAPEG